MSSAAAPSCNLLCKSTLGRYCQPCRRMFRIPDSEPITGVLPPVPRRPAAIPPINLPWASESSQSASFGSQTRPGALLGPARCQTTPQPAPTAGEVFEAGLPLPWTTTTAPGSTTSSTVTDGGVQRLLRAGDRPRQVPASPAYSSTSPSVSVITPSISSEATVSMDDCAMVEIPPTPTNQRIRAPLASRAERTRAPASRFGLQRGSYTLRLASKPRISIRELALRYCREFNVMPAEYCNAYRLTDSEIAYLDRQELLRQMEEEWTQYSESSGSEWNG